jgi:hypothetical protein
MSEKYKFDDPDGMYFVTPTIVGWVDLFTRPEPRICWRVLASLAGRQAQRDACRENPEAFDLEFLTKGRTTTTLNQFVVKLAMIFAHVREVQV